MKECPKCGQKKLWKFKRRIFKWIDLPLDGVNPSWWDRFICLNCGTDISKIVEPQLDPVLGVRILD
mgnify:CR=1 FL=1